MLILYYNTLWGMPLAQNIPLPDGFEITTDRKRYNQAQVVVFHIPQWKWQPHFLFPPKLPHQLWVAWSMESAVNYPRLKDAQFMQRFDVTMTYRLNSDVPVPYFDYYGTAENLARAVNEPPEPKTARAPIAMFISSATDRSGRRELAYELMRSLYIDSYGKFLNNARIANDQWRPSKLECIKQYKFTIAFENALDHDYVTEKFFDPLAAGSVPIYLGAPNVDTFAPGDHCYINAQDFATPRELVAHIQMLIRDEAAYNSYLAWREKPLRPSFVALVERFRKHTQTRLCEWLQGHYLALDNDSRTHPINAGFAKRNNQRLEDLR